MFCGRPLHAARQMLPTSLETPPRTSGAHACFPERQYNLQTHIIQPQTHNRSVLIIESGTNPKPNDVMHIDERGASHAFEDPIKPNAIL